MSSYYVALDGQQAGPFSFPEIQSLVNSGRATAANLCWANGMADWQPLGVVLPSIGARNIDAHSVSQPPFHAGPAYNPYTAPQVTPSAFTQNPRKGVGRLAFLGLFVAWIVGLYLAFSLGQNTVGHVAFLIMLVCKLMLLGKRLENIGTNSWLAFVVFLPLLNLILWCYCVTMPEDYARTKTMDTPAKVVAIFFLVIFALAILGVIQGR